MSRWPYLKFISVWDKKEKLDHEMINGICWLKKIQDDKIFLCNASLFQLFILNGAMSAFKHFLVSFVSSFLG